MRSEFEFINNIKNKFRLAHVGDDCAVLPKDEKTDLLITADLLVEDVDFRLSWATPESLGHKALAVSLSDIAAMAGTPTSALLSIGVPETLWNSDFLDRFYEGWHALAHEYDVNLVGGDVSRAPTLTIDSVVLGEGPRGRAITRGGARVGDLVYVSGSLGGAAAGLALLEGGKSGSFLIEKQLKPLPQIGIANSLLRLNIVTSMIDLSDGLSSDLRHLCEASGVGAEIDPSKLPIDEEVRSAFPYNQAQTFALDGGEDFELLFTVTGENGDRLANLPVTQIGVITDVRRGIEITDHGSNRPLKPGGFKHF